jgi:hypothetical protein
MPVTISGRESHARGQAGQVVDERHRARDGGEVHDLARHLAQAVVVQRGVARAEVDGARLHLLDAGAAADRLVVDLDAGLLVIDVEPLRVDRVRERRAGARECLRNGGGSADARGERGHGENALNVRTQHGQCLRSHDCGLLNFQNSVMRA